MQLTQPTKLLGLGILRASTASDALSRPYILLLCTLVFCGLSGCALLQPHEDPTRFYVLTGPSVWHERAGDGEFKRWKVGLRPVEVPAYLRSKAIVVSVGTNEVLFADYDRWAEPLAQGISRVMKETLNCAQNVESVTLDSYGDDKLDYGVMLQILACEGVRVKNGKCSIRFVMKWEVRSNERNSMMANRGVFTAAPLTWNGKDYGQLAERLSEVIAGAGKALAAELPLEVKVLGKAISEK